jgi:hypothetical protein
MDVCGYIYLHGLRASFLPQVVETARPEVACATRGGAFAPAGVTGETRCPQGASYGNVEKETCEVYEKNSTQARAYF